MPIRPTPPRHRPSPQPPLSPTAVVRRVRHDRRTRPVVALVLVALSLIGAGAEHDRLRTARQEWGPATTTWIARDALAAGHLLAEVDVVARRLPPVAVPVDAVAESPVGRRLTEAVGAGEVLQNTRLSDGGTSANGSRVGNGRGAVALSTTPTPLDVGDVVDLYALLDGTIVATGAEVIAVTDQIPLVAVDHDDLGAVIRSFSLGDVVPVLVG